MSGAGYRLPSGPVDDEALIHGLASPLGVQDGISKVVEAIRADFND